MSAPPGESVAWQAVYHGEPLSRRRRATYGRKLRRLGLMTATPGLRTLDIACGPGEALALLAARGDNRLFGVDLAALPGRAAEPFHRAVGDGARLPFRDAAFDRVMCLHSLHHFRTLGRLEAMLRESRRVLSAHGALFLLDHFDSSYLRLLFRLLETRGRCFPAAARHFGAQLREERDLIAWWLANWHRLFQLLEDTGFQVRRFEKGLFFFYLSCSPRP